VRHIDRERTQQPHDVRGKSHNPATLIFRKMRAEDLDRVVEIENRAFLTPWSRSSFEAELKSNSKAHYLVACEGEKVVGYIGAWFIFEEAHITNIAVDSSRRGRGIGDRLLAEFVEYCRARSIKRMTLEVRRSNEVAIGLYKKHDFKALGVRKGYYTDTGEDALLMWKVL
jgi:ribosomal-protein-alanine N-acetyltransferase